MFLSKNNQHQLHFHPLGHPFLVPKRINTWYYCHFGQLPPTPFWPGKVGANWPELQIKGFGPEVSLLACLKPLLQTQSNTQHQQCRWLTPPGQCQKMLTPKTMWTKDTVFNTSEGPKIWATRVKVMEPKAPNTELKELLSRRTAPLRMS